MAVILVRPGARPVTDAVSPIPSTSATDALLVVHDTVGLGTGSPLASPTAANSVILPPTPTDVGPEIWRKAPPAPASCRDTGNVVVSPAAITTPEIVDRAR